jgi:hypothetical protein
MLYGVFMVINDVNLSHIIMISSLEVVLQILMAQVPILRQVVKKIYLKPGFRLYLGQNYSRYFTSANNVT